MHAEELSDRELVRRTLAGEGAALSVLHRRYYARIYRLALFRCRSAADAEDIAAETFVRAIDHLPGYRFQGESLFPWLSRIASNLAVDQQRRRTVAPTLSYDQKTAEDIRTLLETLEFDGPDPHTLAERHATREILAGAIGKLPADQADVIWMRFGGDLPLAEIAAALGRSEGAIKSLIHRGLVNLRKSLAAHADEMGVPETLRRVHASTETTAPTPVRNHGYIEL
jgi:RNA polymerase sigma-70 factor (ECF subfamily)